MVLPRPPGHQWEQGSAVKDVSALQNHLLIGYLRGNRAEGQISSFKASHYQGCVVESGKDFELYLIPPSESGPLLPWIGRQRAQAFRALSADYDASLELDGRDTSYWHFLIWDSDKQRLIGGQRLLFVGVGKRLIAFDAIDESCSYLEHCYPGFSLLMKAQALNYAEIGRTFVMPEYQGGRWLQQLIRAFVCLPESMGIRHAFGMISFKQGSCGERCGAQFLSILESWLGSDSRMPVVPATQFPVVLPQSDLKNQLTNSPSVNEVVEYLLSIDPCFLMPPVLGPYLSLCPLRYHGVSLARTYNQIWQLLFSGCSDLINERQRRYLKPYSRC